MQKEYDYLVFIGRFNPFHIGHFSVVKLALQRSQEVIVFVGSCNCPRTARNPLTFEERKRLIESLLSDAEKRRVHIVPQPDYVYNNERWIADIQTKVNEIGLKTWRAGPPKVGLIGHQKDGTSFYLKMFPKWESLSVPAHYVINASDIRNTIYTAGMLEPSWFVHHDHLVAVERLFNQSCMASVFAEAKFLEIYKQQWANSPYPPVFVTVDAVVTQSGHVLMVRRKAMPGEGQWALPGGFINQYETIDEAVVRELIEETRIGVQKSVLLAALASKKVFDDPYRSQRGRTITHAYHFALKDAAKLPKVKGSDDAASAQWIALGDLIGMQEQIYEDHFHIIDNMVGL